jgi:hypothetical protein
MVPGAQSTFRHRYASPPASATGTAQSDNRIHRSSGQSETLGKRLRATLDKLGELHDYLTLGTGGDILRLA